MLHRGSPADQQAASAWLQNLLDQPEAAHTALELLRPGQPEESQFFAANMLLSAVKRHWASYDSRMQESIDGQIRSRLQSIALHESAS